MKRDDIMPEQYEKLAEAKTPAEILALIEEEGYELSDEELNAVSGGDWGIGDIVKKGLQCPNCHGYEVYRVPQPGVTGVIQCACKSCGLQWNKSLGFLDSYNE